LVWVDGSYAKLALKPADDDPCLFTEGEGKDAVRIGLYVDDTFLIRSPERVRKLVASIAAKFETNDVRVLTSNAAFKLLGMELVRKSEATLGIVMQQERYARQLLERFGMKDCKPVSCPMVPGGISTGRKRVCRDSGELALLVR
jgi:hypothetical protein